VEQENKKPRNNDTVYSKKVKAGRRRTYFVDVRETKSKDYYITLTESKKTSEDTYEKHKLFLYKEDFNKFLAAFSDAVNHVKTELMPEFDFTQFDRDENEESNHYNTEKKFEEPKIETPIISAENNIPPANSSTGEEDLKW